MLDLHGNIVFTSTLYNNNSYYQSNEPKSVYIYFLSFLFKKFKPKPNYDQLFFSQIDGLNDIKVLFFISYANQYTITFFVYYFTFFFSVLYLHVFIFFVFHILLFHLLELNASSLAVHT